MGSNFKFKYLQKNYKPHKPKPLLGFTGKFFDEIEEYLTPESEKKKNKKEGKDDSDK